jgi:hypothetical protein
MTLNWFVYERLGCFSALELDLIYAWSSMGLETKFLCCSDPLMLNVYVLEIPDLLNDYDA